MDDHAARTRVGEIEEALAALERLPAAPRELAFGAVGALVELYGEALARMLARMETTCPETIGSLAADELVGHLLLIHGLHPVDLRTRVLRALDEVGEALDRDVEVHLVDLDEGAARLRVRGGARTAETGLPRLVEELVRRAAPELDHVEIELPGPTPDERPPRLVQIRLTRPGRNGSGDATAEEVRGA